MQSPLAVLSSVARSVAARTSTQQPLLRARTLLGRRRSGSAVAEQRRRVQDAQDLSVRARLEQGTSLLRMRSAPMARDIFCNLVKELEVQRACAPGRSDARLLAAAYAGRARAFVPATPDTCAQVLQDFDTAMRLDPAWAPILQYERRMCELQCGSAGPITPLADSKFMPVRF